MISVPFRLFFFPAFVVMMIAPLAAPAAIQSGSGCTFQHGHALDVNEVQVEGARWSPPEPPTVVAPTVTKAGVIQEHTIH